MRNDPDFVNTSVDIQEFFEAYLVEIKKTTATAEGPTLRKEAVSIRSAAVSRLALKLSQRFQNS